MAQSGARIVFAQLGAYNAFVFRLTPPPHSRTHTHTHALKKNKTKQKTRIRPWGQT